MGKRGIRYVITDSWEAGAQNWTDNMIAEFTKRRGYDPHPWLPVLTGHVVESARGQRPVPVGLAQDDCRPDRGRALRPGAGVAERARHGPLRRIARGGRAFIADGMEVKKLDDIPMSAMWTQTPGREQASSTATTRTIASRHRWRTSTGRTWRRRSR